MSPLDQLIASSEANLAKLKAQAALPTLSVQEMVAAEMAKYQVPVAAPVAPPAPAPVAAPVAASAPGQTEAQVLQGLLIQLGAVFKKALSTEDYAYMVKHISEGAPGIIPFLNSGAIVDVAGLVHEEYKLFLAGKSK